ncbi:MAG: hypothetical protein HYU56_02975 [Candidatus Aenigmarchaeota archaeon]|nr:hypothetical protein [Candidatus Aenigmarchaeota archaeon]
MRDAVLFAHIILGAALAVLSIIILLEMKKRKSSILGPLSVLTAGISWFVLVPAGILYINFYPATKTLIKAGAWPWAHSIFMETKEHWGLLLPVIATVAAGMVLTGRIRESRKWWLLLIAVTVLIGVMGRVVKLGAFA